MQYLFLTSDSWSSTANQGHCENLTRTMAGLVAPQEQDQDGVGGYAVGISDPLKGAIACKTEA